MKKIIILALLAMSLQAESFAEKKRMCHKTYVSFMSIAGVMGFGKAAYQNKLPEITYYCKSTTPSNYNSFVNSMNRAKGPSKAMRRVYNGFNNHNMTCINAWKKINRLSDNARFYQKTNKPYKTKAAMVEARDLVNQQFKVNCGNSKKSRRFLKDLQKAINIYVKKGY